MTSTAVASTTEPEEPAATALREALALQMELTAVLARGRGVDRLLGDWHSRTGEAVAVFDRLGRALGRSRSFPPEQLAEAEAELTRRPPALGEVLELRSGAAAGPGGAAERDGAPADERGEAPRTPSRLEATAFAGNDTVRGYLVRRPSGRPTAELAAPALRALLALEYERHWLMDEPARRERSGRFSRLLALTEPDAARAWLRRLGVDAEEVRGVAIEARSVTHAEVLVDDLAAMFSTPLIRHRERVVECLLPLDPRRPLAEYGLDVPVGIGTPSPAHHAARTMSQAALALETSRRVGAPIEYRDGASHEFLVRVVSPAYLEAFARAALDAIESARGGEALLETLRTWLVERRSIDATAKRMDVHRHTVHNRIRRIAQLTGHDLDSIDTQTELWLALKARGR